MVHDLYAGVLLFSQGSGPSIVAAEGLNCCVRHGNRCFPLAMDTSIKTTNLEFLPCKPVSGEAGTPLALLANRGVDNVKLSRSPYVKYDSLKIHYLLALRPSKIPRSF